MSRIIGSPQIFAYSLPSLCAAPRCLNSPIKGRSYCVGCEEERTKIAAAKKTDFLRREAGRILSARNAPEGYTWIYFIQAQGGGGRIKIGRAVNLMARLGSMQSGSPIELKLKVAILAKPSLEEDFHFLFASFRSAGEWFEPCPGIFDTISALLSGRIPNSITNIYRTVDTRSPVIYHPS